MPTSDVRLERVFPIIDRVCVKDGWQASLSQAKAAYASGQLVTNVKIQDPDEPPTDNPTWIKPREAFGLWAYGGIIHGDYAKESRWNLMGPVQQAPIRQMAHDYTMMLLDEAEYLTRLMRYGLAIDLRPAAVTA